MSVTLATVADALIEFILSLLRDPEAEAEFDEDPEGALATRGLSNVSHADVCAVAPVIVERTHVVPVVQHVQHVQHHSRPASERHDDPVIREIRNITQQFSWVDDRDTIVDQSVNQNIWTEGGDLTQNFDNDAVVASGDDAIAAGNDVGIETNIDDSTTIQAGEDVQIGDNTTTDTATDSYNETTDTSTSTDDSTTVIADESFNDTSADSTVGSENVTVVETAETNTEVDANVAFESEDTVIDDSPDDEF